MKLDKFTGPGSTDARRRFWNNVADTLMTLQKREGKNVSVREYPTGSLISVNPQRAKTQQTATGACCIDGVCSITTQSDCLDSGGNYLGDNTTCDGVDCAQGACCIDGVCTLTTEEDCTGDFQGYGTKCEPNPCPPAATGACCNHADGSCSITTRAECEHDYLGDGTTCGACHSQLPSCPGTLNNCAFDVSGITATCPCFTGSSPAVGYEFTDASGANGTFSLSRTGTTWHGAGGSCHYKRYAVNCLGTLIDEGETSISAITVECTVNGWIIIYDCTIPAGPPGIPSIAFQIFGAVTSHFDLTVPNQAVCGSATLGINGTATLAFS